MLIQLPNGDYVKPEVIERISASSDYSSHNGKLDFYHIVEVWSMGICIYRSQPLYSYENAVELRDSLADQVNKALYATGEVK